MNHLRRTLALTLTGLLAGTALAGCGSGSNGSPSGSPSASGTGSSTAAAPSATSSAGGSSGGGVPSGYPTQAATLPGLSLTAPGTSLHVGQAASVAWAPTQSSVGALDVTVTGLYATSFKKSFRGWQLDAATKTRAPYFVTATVRNTGGGDLRGRAVPLYGTAASGALVEASTFATNFKPCRPGVLPKPFPVGASAQVCLVYLVPSAGRLVGASFRPTQDFDPITWSGTVTPLPKHGVPAGPPSGASMPASLPASSTASPKPHVSASPVR